MAIRHVLVSGVLVGSTVYGQPPLGPHEESGDAHLKPEHVMFSAPANPAVGQFLNVQVNTIRAMNVVADAANEPSIAVHPTAPLRMAVGWRQFDTIESDFRQAGYSWSVDGGRTWSGVNVIEPGVFRTDPVLDTAADGTFFYMSYYFAGNDGFDDLFISRDGGMTWPTKSFAYGYDKPWFTVDRTGGMGHDHLYSYWFSGLWPGQFSRSTSKGLAWDVPIQPDLPYWGTLDVDPEGTLYLSGYKGSKIRVLRSDDARDARVPTPTFTTSIISLDEGSFVISGDANNGGYTSQVYIRADPTAEPLFGDVYLLSLAEGAFDDPAGVDVILLYSYDGAQSWSSPIRVNDRVAPPIERWFGTMDMAPNGRIDVVFNDNRDAPNGEPNLTRTYYTYSVDGGATWSPDKAIGPQWDSHIGWPGGNSKIGDYYDLKSDLLGANLIYATTYNGEQDVYFARIGPYDCNSNAIDDEIDIDTGASTDCNRNDIPDECEIAAGTLHDDDGDGLADECACPADLNGDGALNILDFVAFQILWQAGDPAADCDGNELFNVIDFVCFQQLFVAGCK